MLYTTNGQGVIYTYSGFGEVKTEQITLGTSRTLQYRYDKHSNRTRVTHPDTHRYFTYGYDQLDRLVNIKETGNNEVITRSYRAQGTPYQTRRHNNQNNVTQYDYDDINRLTDLDWLQNSTSFNARDFTYNQASQVESVSTSNHNLVYQGNHNLVYQGNHNLTGTWQANGLNQISSIAGQAYTWDGNANLESDGSTTYTYDRENRLISATGVKNITLTYDPLGRLHTSTANNVTTTFLYSGDALVAEYQGATLTKVYVHGAGTDNPLIEYTTGAINDTSRRYLHSDHQGSIVGMSDSSGNVTAFNTYDAFGIPHQSNQGRFSYTGQIYLPELEMYHYKARVYDPILGRFLQTDPIGYDDQMNLYAYVHNDPMNLIDPTGMGSCQFSDADICIDFDRGGEVLGDPAKQKTVFNSGNYSENVTHYFSNAVSRMFEEEDQKIQEDFKAFNHVVGENAGDVGTYAGLIPHPVAQTVSIMANITSDIHNQSAAAISGSVAGALTGVMLKDVVTRAGAKALPLPANLAIHSASVVSGFIATYGVGKAELANKK